jgi:hypothetical protein
MNESIPIPRRVRNLSGRQYGKLKVISYAGIIGGQYSWLCLCECGQEIVLAGEHIKRKRNSKCICSSRQDLRIPEPWNPSHGIAKHPLYNIWIGMIDRCRNPNNISYKRYGDRGIQVCDRWMNSIESFAEDMGPRPSAVHSIDRLDNDGPYSPENCEWRTSAEQNRNQCSNVWFEHEGRKMVISDWAKELGVERKTLIHRLKIGVPVAIAFSAEARNLPGQRRFEIVEIDGESLNVRDWCERYGITTFLYYRRIKQGWDSKRAILTPPRRVRKLAKNQYSEETSS